MKKSIFPLMLILVSWFSSEAQNTQSFSLEQAIQTALSNNKSIKAALLDKEINAFKKGEMNAAFYPTIDGTVSVNHFIDMPQQFLPASFLNPQAPDGEVVGVEFGVPNSSSVGLSAQWLIYNQAVFTGFKVLKAQNEMADISIEKKQNDVAYSVTQLYYGIAFANEQKSILEKNVEGLEQLLKIVESNYENGFIKKIDVDKVKVNKINLESQLENLTTVIQTQENFLKMLIGIETNTELLLTDQFSGETLNAIFNANLQPKNTTDYRLLEKQIELNEIERQSIIADYLPTVGLAYNYTYNWQSDNLSSLFSSDLKYPQQNIGLQINVPIFDGRRNEFKLRQNEVKSLQLQTNASYLSDKISTDITNARIKYNQNISAIATRKTNTDLAQQVLDQTTAEYKEGIVALREVIDSETALREAQTQYLNAVSDALMGLLEYKKASGTLLK